MKIKPHQVGPYREVWPAPAVSSARRFVFAILAQERRFQEAEMILAFLNIAVPSKADFGPAQKEICH
jgi:hypothetical protein